MSRLRIGHPVLIGMVTLMVALGSCGSLAAELKIGVVSLARALENSPQRVIAENQLEKEFGSRERDLLAGQRNLKSMEDNLSRDGAVMSETQRADLEKQIQKERREVRRTLEEFREDLRLRRVELMGGLQSKILSVIQALGKSEKFDLVLSNDVIYASKELDITDLVINRLKEAGN